MKAVLKNILYCSLIVSYAVVILVGNVNVLKEVLNSGDNLHQISSEKKSRSIPDTPVWTVKKHTLPTYHTEFLEQYVPCNEISPLNKSVRHFANAELALIYSSLDCLPSKPRDPPIV